MHILKPYKFKPVSLNLTYDYMKFVISFID